VPKEKLDPEEFQLVIHAIANSDRYEVMNQIYLRMAVTAERIASELKMPSASVRHHVRRLERAGLVQGAREGRTWHWMACQERWRAFLEDVNSVGRD
jgi:predicted transcriptional regulator